MSNCMKILFWADGFWPRIGGTETQGMQFIQEMQQRGHEFLVLAQKDDPSWKDEEIYRGVSIRRFDFNATIRDRNLKGIGEIQKWLQQVAKEFAPDIIYLNTMVNGSAALFLLFRKLFRAAAIATIHVPDTPLIEKICAQVDHLCSPSRWGFGIMQKYCPSLRMIPYGLALPKLPPSPLPFSPPTLLLLGRLSSEKGFEVAIEAFSLLKKTGSNAKLLIAGEGPERPFLEHLASQMDLFVQFTGGLSQEEVPSVINQSTFVVMPSHLEPFGLVALESMQMGRPVIASNAGGLPEIVSHGQTGLLVPPKDPLSFFRAMQTLLNNPEKTTQMGIRARQWAMRTYLLEHNVDQYEELFHQCLQ